jgi:hypothetical protein
MADPVSVVAQATTSSTWVDSPVSSSVSESDAARFSDLMSTQQTQAQAPAPVDMPPAPAPAVAPVANVPHGGSTLGDSILRNMDSVGRAYKARSLEVNEFLNADSSQLSPSHLLRLQAQMLDQSVIVDVFSRGISKSVQELDQMTKLQ